jgi:hypothetical protein
MNLGFIVNNLGGCEQNFEILNLVTSIGAETNNISPYIFYQNLIPPMTPPNCFMMNIVGVSNFTGTAVCFNLDTAQILLYNNSHTDNWLFLWDIPWLTQVMAYDVCLDILSKFKIVVRSESHQTVVKNFTNREDIYIAKNMEELYKCLI